MQEYNIEFTYFRNELKLRRKTLSNSTKIEKVTPTESQTHVTIRIAKKKRWEFVQDGDIILDENEAHRFVEGRDVKVFTQYLSILNSVAIHTDTLAIGTMPLPLIPENSDVYNTKKWDLNRSLFVNEENSRVTSNYIFVPETYNAWKERKHTDKTDWETYNFKINCLFSIMILYFERDEKRIDRFLSLALITLLNTLPVYFNKHPHDHEQLQATLQKRIQASEPYKGMCNTFIDSMAEALYLLIHVFPTYGNKEIVWCSEIVNLATKSIDQEHWPEFRSKKRFDLLNRWVESAWDGMTLKSENGGNAHLWWSNIIKDEDMDPHRKSHQAAGNSIEDLMKKDHNDEKMKDVSIMGMKSDGTCGVQ